MAEDEVEDKSSNDDDPVDEPEPEREPGPDPEPPAKESAPNERWRRLHTLSGALALGGFLVEHLLTNASALGGEARFESIVGLIERSSLLLPIEIVFILIPLGFHVGYGIKLLRDSGATADAQINRYGDRRLWVVQRISGTIVLAFVLIHLWELRIQKLVFGMRPEAFYTTLTTHLSWTWAGVPWMALLYLIGIAATTFHFANGLFAATAAWGIWNDDRRRARMVSSTLGVLLFLVGATTVIGIATGTRLLPAPEQDSAACGPSAVPAPAPPAPAPTPRSSSSSR